MRRQYREGNRQTLAIEMDYYNNIDACYEPLAEEDYAAILTHLPSIGIQSAVLDVGCGSGAFGLRLQRHVASQVNVGLDLSLNLLSQHPFLPVVGNGQTLPFACQTFDLIVACAALHHIHNLSVTLVEIFRCLKPSGYVMFIEPNADHPYRRLVVDGGLLRKYFLQTTDESIFPEDLARIMEQVGFASPAYWYMTFRNRRPSILGRTQSLIARLPTPRQWERYIHPWFVLVAQSPSS